MKAELCFPAKVLDQHLVVLGKTGAGKSSALRHIVEHLLNERKRVCIVDPKGDWWGLKYSADGKETGFPVIAFGDFKEPKAADVPINAQSGKDIAELITSGNRPCVIGFRGWMPGAMTDFWIDFASTLFNSNEGELYLVGDEFHNFAPKGKIMDPKAGKVLHWSNRILSEGRGLGLICLIASQRPQKVHNDTLTCCETLVAMRVNHTADRGAVKDWIDGCGDPAQGKELLGNVAGMARGEAFMWSPEIGFGPERVKFPMFRTFDSFAPPQLQKKVITKDWSTVDLSAVKEKLAAVIKEHQDNDPRELKRQILELRRQLASKPKPEIDEAAVSRAVESALVQREREHKQQLAGFQSVIEKMQTDMGSIGKLAARYVEIELPKERHAPVTVEIPRRRESVPPLSSRAAVSRAGSQSKVQSGDMTGPEQRILDAIAWLNSIGVDDPEQTAVAFLAGYTIGGGAFNNPRGRLNQRGLVQYIPGDKIRLTDEGRQYANVPMAALDAGELQRQVLARLPGPEQKILKVLLESYPNGLSNEECASRAGYQVGGGAYNNPRGRLRTLGLIEYPESGKVAARSILFLEN